MANKNLNQAKSAKQDEFYTQLSDIENELRHYKQHFKGKIVLCNCDDPRVSNFFHYFSYNFEQLGLKKLITTCYKSQERDLFSSNSSERAIWLEYNGDRNGNRVPDPEEIGIHSIRIGNEVGTHEILISNGNETLTIKHEAENRVLFAEGALKAAAFLCRKPAGLYNMKDLIG